MECILTQTEKQEIKDAWELNIAKEVPNPFIVIAQELELSNECELTAFDYLFSELELAYF